MRHIRNLRARIVIDTDYLILALGGYLAILGGLLVGLVLVGSLP